MQVVALLDQWQLYVAMAWHSKRPVSGDHSGGVLSAEHAWSARDVERALFSAAAAGMQPRAEPAVTGGKRKREPQKFK